MITDTDIYRHITIKKDEFRTILIGLFISDFKHSIINATLDQQYDFILYVSVERGQPHAYLRFGRKASRSGEMIYFKKTAPLSLMHDIIQRYDNNLSHTDLTYFKFSKKYPPYKITLLSG